ncbi:hypothetical protein CBA19CS22_12280 [Caballeronia novacaledonica]|uniref:Uncharacterized protein n=1 Tax=Caballeronia novacaledonica TaxID=1544861 RepID=A0ACB5QR60_9BURK|nr:hypothetical protein CBA19CS22_12280 [Caballeronia novacaledonica]
MNPLQSRLAAFLLTLVVASGLIVLSKGADQWWGGLLQNLGSGLLTSLFLIAIYDRILEQRLAAEASARERTALRKLRHATKNHVRGLLFRIYRSARPVPIPVYPLRLQVARTDVFDAAKGNRPTWPYAHVEGCRASVRGMQR